MSSAVDTTSIEYEAVRGAVQDITNRSEGISHLLEDFRSCMGKIYQPDVFEGEASDAFEEKYAELKAKFDDYAETVKQFADVIEYARSETQETEQAITRAAEELDS